ncbi:hypothetical protein B7463_g11215, partial [Scytalidium lignicola]
MPSNPPRIGNDVSQVAAEIHVEPAAPAPRDDITSRMSALGSGTNMRIKRNRYTSLAWEFQSIKELINTLGEQVTSLQKQVKTLSGSHGPQPQRRPGFSTIEADSQREVLCRPSLSNLPPGSQVIQPSAAELPHNRLSFHDPMSTAFDLDVAKSSLETMGITTQAETGMREGPTPLEPTSIDFHQLVPSAIQPLLEAAISSGLARYGLPGPEHMSDDKTKPLKLILAISLVIEGRGQSEMGERIFNTVKASIDAKISQIIGIAARMCVELGLHRRDALARIFPAESDQMVATTLFWTVYGLDYRYSLETGLPFIIRDEDIDPLLPKPDSSYPYLRCMIALNSVCSKVWYSGLGSACATDTKLCDIEYLDYKVLQWFQQIPDELKYSAEDSTNSEQVTRALQRMRVMLHLRGNQMRMLIYRSVLYSAASIMQNRELAEVTLNLAKNTIDVLTRLNDTTDLYQRQPICFNHFLIAAISILLLAVLHAPLEFAGQLHEKFYTALDLLKHLNIKSYVSRQLYRTVRELREVVDKLGLLPRRAESANLPPVTTTNQTRDEMDNVIIYEEIPSWNELRNSSMNGQQISNELTDLFQAATVYEGFRVPESNSDVDRMETTVGQLRSTGEGLSTVLGRGVDVSRMMRDIF